MKIVVILLFSLFFQTFTEDLIEDDKTIKDMKSTLWNRLTEGFHLLQGNLIPKNHTVIAFSSLNKTGYTDIVTYVKDSDQQYSFYKHIYDKEKFSFEQNKTALFTINDANIDSVRNLFVGKLYVANGVDICYLASFNKKGSNDELIHYIKCKETESPKQMQINSNILILNRNFNGEGHILFSKDNKLKMCKLNETDYICEKNIEDFNADSHTNITISLNGGMAYVDVDGNCSPDIILSHEEGNTRYINVYLSSRKTEYNYKFAQNITVGDKDKYGPFIISKINNTKSEKYAPFFDILVPKIDDSKIIVFKNKIVKDYKWDKFFCNEDEGEEVFEKDVFDINATSFDVESYGEKAKFDKSLTPMITPGDFSAEDQQGLLVRQKSDDGTVFISLFSKDAEKFNLQLNVTNNTKIGNLTRAVFYDINEAGALGLIVQNDKLQNFFIYNFRRDKYFIKSKLMNDKEALYDINIGASFRFIVTSKDGSRHMDISYQLAQTSDTNIPLPYSLMGLGETNNYVENFQILSGNYYIMGKENFDKEKYRNFRDHTPVIPNTQMAIYKFKNGKNKIEWYIDLYVLPTDTLLIIALSIVGFMLVILGIIIYLHVREVKEEQKETNKFKSWFA
jgi:hypothetical protein